MSNLSISDPPTENADAISDQAIVAMVSGAFIVGVSLVIAVGVKIYLVKFRHKKRAEGDQRRNDVERAPEPHGPFENIELGSPPRVRGPGAFITGTTIMNKFEAVMLFFGWAWAGCVLVALGVYGIHLYVRRQMARAQEERHRRLRARMSDGNFVIVRDFASTFEDIEMAPLEGPWVD